MSHWITMVTPHGPMNGWSAEPDDKPLGGVVLVHEVFGVNEDMCKIAERYAQEGYLTVVPALFDKIQREVELSYSTEDFLLGSRLAMEIGHQTATELVVTAADAIAHAGKVAVIGYGWGAGVAAQAAQLLELPCILYHGEDSLLPANRLEIPMLIHCTEGDSLHEQLLRELGPSVRMSIHAAQYGFDRASDAQYHNLEAAESARRSSFEFLRHYIRGEDA